MKNHEIAITLPDPHAKQRAFIDSPAKRKIIRAGRRSGKTVGVAIFAVEKFLQGIRVLYAAPTAEQIDRFWTVITRALYPLTDSGIFKKNETEHLIELPGTEQRIRAKTAWNADTLRGDYADLLILDEWQLMDEDAWYVVGAPMLLDHDGDAVFIYTPPSLRSRSVSKARDPQHAAKMFSLAKNDKSGRWEAFHFTSHDNPHISTAALAEITKDMSGLAYRQEIEAEDVDEAPGALWKRKTIENYRLPKAPEELDYIVVGVDPSATSTGDDAGIIGIGKKGEHIYILADSTLQGSPLEWATATESLFNRLEANKIVAEVNNGGEMVKQTILTVNPKVTVEMVHASRGKQTRAEPIATMYEQGRAHHVGNFPALEDEMCLWVPGDASPNRMDALVWAAFGVTGGGVQAQKNPFYSYDYVEREEGTSLWD